MAINLAEVLWGIEDGGLFSRDASASLNDVNGPRLIINRNPFNDGSGVGGENYANEVFGFGWNMSDTIGVPDDDTKSMCWDGWEFKYNIAGKYHHERHFETVDVNGVRHRPWSFAVPHDGGSGSGCLIAIDLMDWYAFNNTLKIKWRLDANNDVSFGSAATGFQFRFYKNNTAPFIQRNAADSAFLNLPYFNASNKLEVTGQQNNVITGTIPVGESGILYNFNNATLVNGSYYYIATGPAVTNMVITGQLFQGSTNWDFQNVVLNQHATGAARSVAQCAAGGRASFAALDGTNQWEWGINAANNFFLGSDNAGSADVFSVNLTNRNVAFVAAPKVPSFTVATLPSASMFGAGSMVFVTDAVGSDCLAISDGSNWKRCDNALTNVS